MAKQVVAYESRCRYCKNTRLSTDKSSSEKWLVEHEELCRHNPIHRDCKSCVHSKWRTYCMWCTLHKLESLSAKIKHLDSQYRCTTWECKKSLKKFVEVDKS